MSKLDEDFLDAMAECFWKGANKNGRSYNDWKRLKWDNELQLLYTSKLIGHMAKGIRGTNIQKRRKHLAAVACNANILWHHIKEKNNDPENERRTT